MEFLMKVGRVVLSLWLALGISSWFLSEMAQAGENMQVCARYQRYDGSYTPFFKVNALWSDGFELNRKLNTDEFDIIKHYMVMEWNYLDYAFFECDITDQPTLMAREYTDQHGRRWQLKNDWDGCGGSLW